MRIALALVLSLLFSGCNLASIRASAGYMALKPSGDVGLEDDKQSPGPRDNNVNGVRSSLGSNYKIAEDATPYLKLEADVAEYRFELSGFQFRDTSRSMLANDFGDIPSGSNVDSELRVTNVKLGVLFTEIVDLELVDLSAGLAFNFFDVDMDVTSLDPQVAPDTTFEETNFQAPVPMLYAQASVNAWIATGKLSAAWIDTFGNDFGDAGGAFLDIDAMVTVAPFTAVEFFGGYRHVNIDSDGRIDGQAFTTNVQLAGWYIGMGMSF